MDWRSIFLAPKPSYQPHKDKEWSTEFPTSDFQTKISLLTLFFKLISHHYHIGGSYYLQGILDEYIPNQMKST